jgi:hypothetical protein
MLASPDCLGMGGLGPWCGGGGQQGVEEPQGRGDRFVPPPCQVPVEPVGGAQPPGKPVGDQGELATLGLQQVARISAGSG